MTAPSIKGRSAKPPCLVTDSAPVVDCSQLQAMDNYIVQITNILGNLDRNKNVFMADTALDRMADNLTYMISAVK